METSTAKILIVEDSVLINRMYEEKFRDDGYEVETATDGAEGLQKARDFRPDLILLDIMMPRMHGLEVLKQLKEDEEIKETPVILLSNLDREHEDIHRGLRMGAVSYLIKSDVLPGEVVAKVKEVLAGTTADKYLPKID